MQAKQLDRVYAESWLGDEDPHLDAPAVFECGRIVIGAYGGNTRAGANKNEDAAFVLTDAAGDWEFAMIADAHYSAESARMLVELMDREAPAVRDILSDQPLQAMFRQLEDHFVELFTSPEVLSRALNLEGEASCLLCARCDRFLWWMSVGDCQIYLLHPELSRLGQYALNQRSFFEWIGFRNTFTRAVPCYASGVRELLPGRSVICLATDGLFEGDAEPLTTDESIYRAYMKTGSVDTSDPLQETNGLLERVHQLQGRDSATIIVWRHNLEN
jgi:serine/threonine protein phosphatase PrpC